MASFAKQYADWVIHPENERETGQLIKLAAKRFLSDLERDDIYFDEAEAVRMCEMCESNLCQWEGDFIGEPLKFQPWQRFHLEQVYGWIRKDTGTRRFNEVYIQIAKKNGKALDINTMIPTPKGWRTMLEINQGDFVFDESGKPVRVKWASEVMHKESFELSFYGGAKIVASGDHLWSGETNDWRKQKNFVSKRISKTVDTNFLFNHYQNKIGGHNIVHVPNCKPVEYSLKNLPIHPYVFGVWLGDGNSNAPQFTCGDPVLVDYIRDYGYEVTASNAKRKSTAINYRLGKKFEIQPILRKLNVINNKHIPRDYLQGSVDQRMELLRGLMDTDGTVSKSGQCTYTGINRVLVNGVFELCLSLGIKATITDKIARCQTGATVKCYNVNFFETRPVFKLERKLARLRKKLNERSSFRTIRSVQAIGKRYVKCISVENESHLYLAGEHFIPTHNSTEAAGVMVDHVFFDPKVNTPKCFTAANNIDQARIAVNMAGKIIEGSPSFYEMLNEEKLIKLMHYGENILGVINEENNGFIKAFSKETGDKTKKTAGGKHGVNASLGVVDEFGMSPDHGASGPIKTSMASRRERLMFYITTAGYNMDGPCYKELRRVGIQVLEGTVIKDNYLPIIYEIDPPKNEKGEDQEITLQWLLENEWCWKQANPNLDVSVVRDFLRESLKDAIQYGGPIASDTLTLNFNMWINSPDVFISADVWNKNNYGLEIEEGSECYAGLEVAPSGELSAFALVFPGEKVKVKMIYFMSEEAMKQNEFYRDNKDLILVDPGNEVEVEVAVNWLTEAVGKYYMHSFGFPSTHKNNSIVQAFMKQGFIGNPIGQALGQIATPTEEWRKMLNAGEVDHGGDPILSWQNSNCLADRKEQGSRIHKNGKVLGIYACINAVAQWRTVEADGINAPIGIIYV